MPAGTPVIDTAGMSVLPGLMDMHVHLMILGHCGLRALGQDLYGALPRRDHAAAAKQLLDGGVTTVRDLGAPLEDILDVRRRIERGEIPGPRLFVSGPFIQHAPYFGLREVRALGRERPRGRARQGAEADRRRASTSSS